MHNLAAMRYVCAAHEKMALHIALSEQTEHSSMKAAMHWVGTMHAQCPITTCSLKPGIKQHQLNRIGRLQKGQQGRLWMRNGYLAVRGGVSCSQHGRTLLAIDPFTLTGTLPTNTNNLQHALQVNSC